MASDRQVAANRRNAARSTGPRTIGGKRRSRRNAYRHGLTAETVITSLEKAGDYHAFEAGIFDDYAPDSAVERELVARLASLLWRLRRATLIETGLFECPGGTLQQRHQDQLRHKSSHPELNVFYRLLHNPHIAVSDGPAMAQSETSTAPSLPGNPIADPDRAHRRKIDTASTYLHLCRTNPGAMKRLTRYETALWRQVAQALLMLETARRNRFPFSKIVAR
jgi:hypothetical protein